MGWYFERAFHFDTPSNVHDGLRVQEPPGFDQACHRKAAKREPKPQWNWRSSHKTLRLLVAVQSSNPALKLQVVVSSGVPYRVPPLVADQAPESGQVEAECIQKMCIIRITCILCLCMYDYEFCLIYDVDISYTYTYMYMPMYTEHWCRQVNASSNKSKENA